MKWVDLKEQILDLGFEEDSTYEEYKRLIINNANRAISLVNYTVVPQLVGYLTGKWGYQTTDSDGVVTWNFPTPDVITTETEDDTLIDLPDNLLVLLPLLAAHYTWLDDDIIKATTYWNEYDDLKNTLILACKIPSKSVITGGF